MKSLIILFLTIHLGACVSKQREEVVILDNIEFPIDGCIEAQKKVMGNSIEPISFCKCLIPKMYAMFKNDPKKIELLKEGKIDQMANNFGDIEGFYDDCLSQSTTKDSTTRITFNSKMEQQIKQSMKKNLEGTEIEKTNDIDKYCDCIIEGMQKDFTAREIMQTDFHSSGKYLKLDQKCLRLSKKR